MYGDRPLPIYACRWCECVALHTPDRDEGDWLSFCSRCGGGCGKPPRTRAERAHTEFNNTAIERAHWGTGVRALEREERWLDNAHTYINPTDPVPAAILTPIGYHPTIDQMADSNDMAGG